MIGLQKQTGATSWKACSTVETGWDLALFAAVLQCLHLDIPLLEPQNTKKLLLLSRLVVSSSVRPHGLQPTRLLRPRDFPGKSTGVGCHCLLLQRNYLGLKITKCMCRWDKFGTKDTKRPKNSIATSKEPGTKTGCWEQNQDVGSKIRVLLHMPPAHNTT